LLAALGLLVLAGWLMLEPTAPRLKRAAVQFPRYARPHEIERQQRRNTFALPHLPGKREGDAGHLADDPAGPPVTADEAALDPVHVALAGGEIAFVVETGVLKDSPLGRMLLACLSPKNEADLRELEQKTGLRPLEQLDRIAVSSGGGDREPVLILSGDLSSFDPSVLGDDARLEDYGQKTKLALGPRRALALWDGRLLVMGSPSGVRAAVARLEGEVPVPPSSLASEAYGEVYGSISGAALSRLLPSQLAGRASEAAQRVVLHVDATDDLLLVADVYGQDQAALSDLGVSLEGALALGRLQAVEEKQPMLSDLLDESRVTPGAGSFQLEMALPLETIERQLGECARQPP
jgi:hypothetical protein